MRCAIYLTSLKKVRTKFIESLSFDFSIRLIKLITIEHNWHKYNRSKIKELLEKNGYIRVYEEGEEFSINTDTDNQLNFAIKLLIG